ncbi:hypothetical protein JXB02_02575 [Candidatus Woesearchaeota archaeon]|nr:hypothetical protein [Candidatus Woesearchaeota archaeon]
MAKQFNKELNNYLETRGRKRISDFVADYHNSKRNMESGVVPQNLNEEEILIEEKEPTFWQRMVGRKAIARKDVEISADELAQASEGTVGRLEHEYEELDEIEREIEERKESVLGKIFKAFGIGGRRPAPDYETVDDPMAGVAGAPGPSLPDDVVQLLKVQNRLIARLPPDEIARFRSSADYAFYKETLGKYGLIKKQGPSSVAPDEDDQGQ